jgi:hypothetical protein
LCSKSASHRIRMWVGGSWATLASRASKSVNCKRSRAFRSRLFQSQSTNPSPMSFPCFPNRSLALPSIHPQSNTLHRLVPTQRALSTALIRLARPPNPASLASAAASELSAQHASVLTTPSTAKSLSGDCGVPARHRVVVGIACARATSSQTGQQVVSSAHRSRIWRPATPSRVHPRSTAS